MKKVLGFAVFVGVLLYLAMQAADNTIATIKEKQHEQSELF